MNRCGTYLYWKKGFNLQTIGMIIDDLNTFLWMHIYFIDKFHIKTKTIALVFFRTQQKSNNQKLTVVWRTSRHRKYQTLNQRCYDNGPPSQTVGRYRNNAGSASLVRRTVFWSWPPPPAVNALLSVMSTILGSRQEFIHHCLQNLRHHNKDSLCLLN